MILAQGSFVAERYSILDKKEDQDSVYLAEDRDIRVGSLQVLVSLRVLDKENYHPLLLENRVKTLRSLDCDCLIKIYDFIKSSELLAVSTERSLGIKLSAEMLNRTYTSFEVVYKLSQIAKAIESLHKAGIIHGSVSPEYIYIDETGKCKLDPIAPDTGGELNGMDDIKALACLGLKLINNANKQGLWTTYSLHPYKLIELLKHYAAGQGNIRSFRSKLDRILLNKHFIHNESEQPLRKVFNSSAYVLSYVLLFFSLISALAFIAFSKEYSATLLSLMHRIEAIFTHSF